MQIRAVLFDVDGVLTDGSLWIGADGETVKPFSAKDGIAVALFKKYGIATGLVSGKESKALAYRAKQLKVDLCLDGCSDKLASVTAWLDKQEFGMDAVAFVGDDVIDLQIMQAASLSFAPADAHILVRDAADYVTVSGGGHGVAREVAEHILQAQGISLVEMYQELFSINQ